MHSGDDEEFPERVHVSYCSICVPVRVGNRPLPSLACAAVLLSGHVIRNSPSDAHFLNCTPGELICILDRWGEIGLPPTSVFEVNTKVQLADSLFYFGSPSGNCATF